MPPTLPRVLAILFATVFTAAASAALQSGEAHVWEAQEIILESSRDYANP